MQIKLPDRGGRCLMGCVNLSMNAEIVCWSALVTAWDCMSHHVLLYEDSACSPRCLQETFHEFIYDVCRKVTGTCMRIPAVI